MVQQLTRYVNDASWVLSEAKKYEINELFAKIDSESSLQAVTALFPHREWRELRDIALEIFNENGIWQKGKNNGLLLVISTEEKKIRIMTGKGLEWIYSESWCRNLIETKLRPLLNQWKYEELIEMWHQAILQRQSIPWNNRLPLLLKNPFALVLFPFVIFFSIPFAIIWPIVLSEIFSFQFTLIALTCVVWTLLYILRKSWKWIKIFIIILFLVSIFIWYQTEKERIFCEANPEICEQQRIERQNSSSSSSSYNSSSSSSSSSWWSSSSSNSSSSSFGWGGGSSNGGGWGD